MGLLAISGGCTEQSNQSQDTKRDAAAEGAVDPLKMAKSAAKEKRWAEAEKLVNQAILENPESAETLALAAEIAFGAGKKGLAMELLADSVRADGYSDQTLVNRCVVGFLSMGQLYQCIDMLEQAVESHPDRHDNRRLLFDFLLNAEERYRALPHGKHLVLQRQFDETLLFSLGTTEERDVEAESMEVLIQRNPTDLRLMLPDIRQEFDRGQYDGLEEKLQAVLKFDPKNVAAKLLLGRVYSRMGNHDQLEKWTQDVWGELEKTWEYWSVLGDLAVAKGNHEQAARAFWESTKRNLDVGDVQAKLAQSLFALRGSGKEVDSATIQLFSKRAELLGQFVQDKDRYYKLNKESSESILDMATTLVKLGRYWEAEAWTALAVAMQDENKQNAIAKRAQVVKLLKPNLPWQVDDGFPIKRVDLSHLDPPDFSEPSGDKAIAKDQFDKGKRFTVSAVPVFEDQAKDRGLVDLFGTEPEKFANGGIPIYAQMEAGGCAIDMDLDGWTDLFVANSSGNPTAHDSKPNQIYRNVQGQFINVSKHARIGDQGFAQGVSFGDVNEDGFHDVVVMNYGSNVLLINNGDGTFARRDDWFPGDAPANWSTSGALADINLDGITDFICTNYCAGMAAVEIPCFDEKGIESPCWPTKFAAQGDDVFAGTSEGKFENVTEEWNFTSAKPGRGLGILVGALDRVAGQDIYVANDMTSNHFWTPGSGETFEMVESATLKGVALDARFRPQASMGIAVSDLDNDDDVDLYVTNFEQEYNTLYKQSSLGIWQDETQQSGLATVSFYTLGFGTQAIDFDNDGQDEIAVANGHVNKDAEPPSSFAQRFQVLRQASPGYFELVALSPDNAYAATDHVGRSMWKLDTNRDGRIDLAITHQFESLALLINQTPNDNAWISLRLVGTVDARDAIGATVTCVQGEIRRTLPLLAGDGFYCANERSLHFGLGEADIEQPIRIEIRWPNGDQQSVEAMAGGSYLIVQGIDSADELR